MSSLHMLRPFSARQLSLVAGEGRVVAFAVLGSRRRGITTDVHVPTLLGRMRDLPAAIDTVVFFDEPVPDGALVALIDDMVDAFSLGESDALAVGVAASEAVKWVEDGTVVREVDRSTLVTIRCPEVIDRRMLDVALASIGDEKWVNPTELVVAAGASLSLHDPGRRLSVS